jgi:hypothetical protein
MATSKDRLSLRIDNSAPQRPLGELVRGGDYSELAGHLHEVLVKRGEPSPGAALPRQLLWAAYGLVQACVQCRREAAWHAEAGAYAARQEQRLQEQLLALLGTAHESGELALPVDMHGEIIEAALETPATDVALTEMQPPISSPPPDTRQAEPTPVPEPGIRGKLNIYCLGTFRVFLEDSLMSAWPQCKGKAIFKYLLTHHQRPVSKELLMETFWPQATPEAARNNLNVAIYGLRKMLAQADPGQSYVLFQEGCYLLNPAVSIWVDAAAFTDHYERARLWASRGEREAAMQEYRAAAALYQGDFLAEDR